jgi:protease-4
MTLEADMLADRRRLKRRLTVWRLTAVVLAVAAILTLAVRAGSDGGLFGHGDHIARVSIEGLIRDDHDQQAIFDRLVTTDRVKAIILHIDSPGGTTSGSEALFAAIRRAAAKKPVVAVLGDVAASGGYIAALASDHIVARGNSITGSIGVIYQWANISGLLETLGVQVEQLKSSDLKAEPDLFEPTPEAAIEVTQAIVDESYEWFVQLVSERRPFDEPRARELSDGRVYTGRQALEVGLVDMIGGERSALAWLRAEHNIATELKVIDWTSEEDDQLSWSDLALSWSLRASGLGDLVDLLGLDGKTSPVERLSLDGLISVWHPDL